MVEQKSAMAAKMEFAHSRNGKIISEGYTIVTEKRIYSYQINRLTNEVTENTVDCATGEVKTKLIDSKLKAWWIKTRFKISQIGR